MRRPKKSRGGEIRLKRGEGEEEKPPTLQGGVKSVNDIVPLALRLKEVFREY